jgi:hypothetical protein
MALVVGGIGAFVGRSAIVEIWHLHRLERGDSEERFAATEVLMRVGSWRSTEPLTTAYLEADTDALRGACAAALAALGDVALERFTARLSSETATTRLVAAQNLIDYDAGEAAVRLLAPLVNEPSLDVRLQMARLLGVAGEHGVPLLVEILAAKEGITRRAAVAALAAVGAPVLGAMEARLLDRRQLLRVRSGALDVVCRLASASARARVVLVAVLRDPEESLRGAAQEALDLLGVAPPGPHLRLRVGSISGAPGDQVSLPVRGDLERFVHGVHLLFDAEASGVGEIIATDFAGTAAADAPSRARVLFPAPRGGGTLVGVWLRGEGTAPFAAGPEQRLFNVTLRILAEAAPGEYSLVWREAKGFGDGGRPLEVTVESAGSVRVKEPPPGQAPRAGEAERDEAAATPVTNVPIEDPLTAVYSVRAETVRCERGAEGVAIRLYGSNTIEARGYSIGLRIDPAFVQLRKLTLEGTAAETAKYDQFLYQKHVLDTGETAAGVLFDTTGERGFRLPKGTDQHLLTVIVDVADDAPVGTIVPVELGAFGDPPQRCVYTVTTDKKGATSRNATVVNGALHIESP